MKTLSLRLPELLDGQLTEMARRTGTGKSALIRDALETLLKGNHALRPGSFLDRARDLAGCAEGPADLSFSKRHLKRFGR